MDATAEARLARVQAVAEEVLARCERVLVPIADAPPADGLFCFTCRDLADVRISMREDGVEMFWANACPQHHAERVRVTFC